MMISLKRLFKTWGVVQPAERVAVNHEVAGSIPAAPAREKGEKMSTTETKALKDAITNLETATTAEDQAIRATLHTELANLRARVSELVDTVTVMETDMRRFRESVARDVTDLAKQVTKR